MTVNHFILFFHKSTFDHTSHHIRSIRNLIFWKFCFTKYPPSAILDGRKVFLIALLAISDQYVTLILEIVSQNVRRRPFWMPEITFNRTSRHFRSTRNIVFKMFLLILIWTVTKISPKLELIAFDTSYPIDLRKLLLWIQNQNLKSRSLVHLM